MMTIIIIIYFPTMGTGPLDKGDFPLQLVMGMFLCSILVYVGKECVTVTTP